MINLGSLCFSREGRTRSGHLKLPHRACRVARQPTLGTPLQWPRLHNP